MKLTQNVYGGGSTYISTYWEHWDAGTGQVLFETGNAGGTIDLGNIGVSNASSGVTVEDRDPFGEIAATHTGLEFSAWGEAPSAKPMGKIGYYKSGAIGSAYPGTDPQQAGRYLDHQRPDAFIDDTYSVSFQGVRTADANTSVWMEPDPLAGSEGDLLSQQPYMWDGNNSLLRQDPSGLCYQDETICVHAAPTDSGLGGEDFANMLGATGPDPMIVFGPIMLPLNRIIGNPRVFMQFCGSAGAAGCLLVDGCGEVVLSLGVSFGQDLEKGKLSLLGASAVMGVAFPFKGKDALNIYTGPSGNMSYFSGPGGATSWNGSGLTAGVGVGVKGFSWGPTAGYQPKWGRGICRKKS